ncbi:hypothetical protein [Rubrivirga sp. IMCC43871]|uniref:hypothetical protein n=1 Tax=Rubrivirga sp. IMCC43871 TaxID=3391575 RepID=UPI0039901A29
MPVLDLSDVGDDLAVYLDFAIAEAQAADDPAARGRAAQSVSAHREAMGLVELLLDANVDGYAEHLARSAQTRLWLLEATAGSDDRARRASYDPPLHDALAIGRFDLARQIAAASETAWMPRAEYEDDFLYAHTLHRYLLDADADLGPTLDRYHAVLDGGDDPRLGLLRALAARDRDAAADAFAAWIDQRAARIEDMKATSGHWDTPDAVLYPLAFVSIPGLAWLRLLADAGLALDDEFQYCPALALAVTVDRLDDRSFPFRPL